MIKKKVILLLNDDGEKNRELITFVNSNFHNCLVEVAFVSAPAKVRVGSLSSYVSSFIDSSEKISPSDNRFRIFPKSIINAKIFVHISKYFDFLVSKKDIYVSIWSHIKKSNQELKHPDIPLLLLPEKNVRHISNIIFVNTSPLEAIQTFKRFCYLFPYLCGSHEVVLLQLYSDYETNNILELEGRPSLAERKLFEYINSKCNHLSVHKAFHKLSDKDMLAINFNNRSLMVLNTANKSLEKGILSTIYPSVDNVSFSTAG